MSHAISYNMTLFQWVIWNESFSNLKKLKLREEARAVFLQRKSRELVDNDELQKLWFLLDGNKSGQPVNDEAMISFEFFCYAYDRNGWLRVYW